MLNSVHIEVGDREMRRLVRERKKFPIRSTQKIKSVQVVIRGCNPEVIELTRHVGKHNIFKAQLTKIMKKYRKGFRELKIREIWKRIDMMAREVMCCCLGKDDLSGE
eukprot:11717254-Ditylum_brightwellii.AAC.1